MEGKKGGFLRGSGKGGILVKGVEGMMRVDLKMLILIPTICIYRSLYFMLGMLCFASL